MPYHIFFSWRRRGQKVEKFGNKFPNYLLVAVPTGKARGMQEV